MSETVLSAQQIQELLPHRWPFLMVDRIIELEPGARAVGLKNVSINEPFFQGHFPGYPIMPGVLIVEALAQVGSVALAEPGDRTRARSAISQVSTRSGSASPSSPATSSAWKCLARTDAGSGRQGQGAGGG